LAGDDDEAGRDQRLARDAAVRVVAENSVEDAVGDLVGDLVWMALCDRLRGEGERAYRHFAEGYLMARKPLTVTRRAGGGPSARRRARRGSGPPARPSRSRRSAARSRAGATGPAGPSPTSATRPS